MGTRRADRRSRGSALRASADLDARLPDVDLDASPRIELPAIEPPAVLGT